MDISLEGYLKSLGVELWPGEAFYLTDDKSRTKAAVWLRNFNRNYSLWVRAQVKE